MIYNAYLGYAIYYQKFSKPLEEQTPLDWCEDLGLILIITGLVYAYFILKYGFKASRSWRKALLQNKHVNKIPKLSGNPSRIVRLIPYVAVFASALLFLILDTADDRRRLISAAGILVFVLILTCFSKHPRQINWRQVSNYWIRQL